MNLPEIQKNIDRAVGTAGVLSIPSWWMHKILSDLVLYCKTLKSSDAAIEEYLESQLNLVGDAIEALDARVSEVESHELFAIVSELPSKPKENTIYLIPSTNGEGGNVLTEWVYVNNAWEQFGEFKADVDLSEYVKKEFGKGLSSNDFTTSEKEKLAGLENYDDAELRREVESLATEVESNNELIEDLQNTKIDKEADDYYPQLAVGLADNLAGVDVVDSEINFRRSGGGAISDGVARIEAIKGNSVVWNEIFKAYHGSVGTKVINGVTYTLTAEGDLTAEGTAEGANAVFVVAITNLINTHKYLINAPSVESSWNTWALYFNGHTTAQNNSIVYDGWNIFQAISTAPANMVLTCWADKTISVKTKVAIYDLTQMFGAGNEPTTIEEFYARIPMGIDLNAYKEGEVIHMDVQSVESVGVNQWDEEWELGRWNTDTLSWEASTTQAKSKNLIRILPNTQYRLTNPSGTMSRYVFYDSQKKFVSWVSATSNATFTTPSNASYMMFGLGTGYGTTYNHDICINISDTSINGKYFPYIKRVEDLSIIRKYFPNGMKSAGTAHDEIRYNKATQKWEMVQRIGEVDMGSLEWSYFATYGFYATAPNNMVVGNLNYLTNLSYSKYAEPDRIIWSNSDKAITNGLSTIGSSWVRNICVQDSAYTDAASFKAAMQGVILYYELAEPIVIELDAEDQFRDLDYQVWNCGTEKAIAEGKSAPLAADITYGFNAIGKIKELESLVAALRAKVGI